MPEINQDNTNRQPDAPVLNETGNEAEPQKHARFSWRELIASVSLVLVVFFVFHVLLGFVPVKGASMQPLINSESDQCTSVVCRLFGPEKGSVVVFSRPYSTDVNLIKRVIATEGDQVVVKPKTDDSRYAEIYLNGTLLSEPYLDEEMLWALWKYSDLTLSFPSLLWHDYGATIDGEEIISFTVPEGTFFALGDNRNDSRDGRHYGFFNTDTTVGRVFLIIDGSGLRFI